jgi:hypothetical protein
MFTCYRPKGKVLSLHEKQAQGAQEKRDGGG